MKKILLIFIFVCILIIFTKYRFSNYNVEYKVNSYNVNETYKSGRFYFEISKGKYTYNFDSYSNRKFTKTKITKITAIKDDNYNCIYPTIKNIKTYPLCYVDNEYIDYNLIDSEKLDKYKTISNTTETDRDFEYYNNLTNNEYVALWNYKGYIVMHNSSYKNIELFKSDRYDNSLAYLLNDTIYTVNYDEEFEYSSLIALNIMTNRTEKIDIGYNIDYDSYIVGNIKNKVYIFDNKHSILYEVNIKKNKTEIIGNVENGFVKYENGKFVSCSKSEYKVDKIKYNTLESNYTYIDDNGLFKTINDNNKLKQKINNNKVTMISEYNNDIYYIYEDNFYKYNPLNGENKIFYNYELTFNSNNTIFVYIK